MTLSAALLASRAACSSCEVHAPLPRMKSVFACERMSSADLYPACRRTLITRYIPSGESSWGLTCSRRHVLAHVRALDSFERRDELE